MNKLIGMLVTAVVTFGVIVAVCLQFAHKLDTQNLAVVQSMTGTVEVRRTPGWWLQISPTIWEYPKAGIYQLNTKDRDTLKIQFNNKSTAELKCMIGYRIDTSDDETLIALHQQVETSDEKIWQMVLTALNTCAQSITTKYDPSMVIGGDKFEPMIKEMYTAIMKNPELLKHGIEVNYFAVDGRPIPDKDTESQFNKQREADLARRLAEAEKLKLESEKIKVEANYAKEIAEFKGKADAETAKLKTEAERAATLAKIEAQKKVDVQELEKQEMLVKANKEKEVAAIEVQKQKEVAKIEAEKLREVAEIQKATEAAKLEAEKLVAEQIKVAALAKKEQIEKSGAITEKEKLQLEIDMKTKIGVAQAYGQALASAKLPQMMVIGGNSGNDGKSTGTNPFDILLQTMTLEKLDGITSKTSASPTVK